MIGSTGEMFEKSGQSISLSMFGMARLFTVGRLITINRCLTGQAEKTRSIDCVGAAGSCFSIRIVSRTMKNAGQTLMSIVRCDRGIWFVRWRKSRGVTRRRQRVGRVEQLASVRMTNWVTSLSAFHSTTNRVAISLTQAPHRIWTKRDFGQPSFFVQRFEQFARKQTVGRRRTVTLVDTHRTPVRQIRRLIRCIQAGRLLFDFRVQAWCGNGCWCDDHRRRIEMHIEQIQSNRCTNTRRIEKNKCSIKDACPKWNRKSFEALLFDCWHYSTVYLNEAMKYSNTGGILKLILTWNQVTPTIWNIFVERVDDD